MKFIFSLGSKVSFGRQSADGKAANNSDFHHIKNANAGLKAKFREDLNHLMEREPVMSKPIQADAIKAQKKSRTTPLRLVCEKIARRA